MKCGDRVSYLLTRTTIEEGVVTRIREDGVSIEVYTDSGEGRQVLIAGLIGDVAETAAQPTAPTPAPVEDEPELTSSGALEGTESEPALEGEDPETPA